jgi:NAD(P)-dependent dehydrogenase (short-subunit alcohol dehydrogenase family)
MVRKFEESGDDMKPAGIPLGREGNPEEVAELIAWLLVTLHHTLLGRYRWWMAEC